MGVPKNCSKCNGTGYRPEVAHVDGGRCWACNKVDTSYTLTLEDKTLDELTAEIVARQAVRRAERLAERLARQAAAVPA